MSLTADYPILSVSNPIQCENCIRVFVCLPCYNESENLTMLIPQINTVLCELTRSENPQEKTARIAEYQILAVDDGSIDDTKKTLQTYSKIFPLTLISHSQNRGLAETIRTLINTVKSHAEENDIIIFMDADNTHPAQVIPDLVEASSSADIVVASRYKNGVEFGVPFNRKILSRIANWIVRNLCNVPVLDCTCGFRAYRGEVLKNLSELDSKGFEIAAEILIMISNHKPHYKFKEVPLALHYDRKIGTSKIHLGKTIGAYFKLVSKNCKIKLSQSFRK
jgi:dolichol-phosphate mannosyltransferase